MAVMNHDCYYCEQIDKVQKKKERREIISLYVLIYRKQKSE